MNQRMLVIIALLLLGAGAIGLLFSEEKAPDSVTVNSYTAAKALAKGEMLTEASYVKKVTELPLAEAEKLEAMPESLQGYETTREISPGEALNTKNIQLASEDRITLKENHFIWPIHMQEEETIPLKQLKKGDRVDLYLRYFVELKGRESKNSEFVSRSGKKIVTPVARMVKIIDSRRLFTLKKSESLIARAGSLAGNDEKKGTIIDVNVELANEDISRIYALSHLGETVVLPAGVPPDNKKIQTLIPEMINEIRGGLRK